MILFLSLLQEVDIEKKLEEAPDASYSIGVFIGTMLPFVILVLIAYAIYRYNKNRIKQL
ncbi:hypothetical protein [Winogradskyella aurantiaca]|uniref:hypothetical protein n=1 Tax=Winogradskyella aurantiaca TaxID=2219558 RepID=UPI0018E53A30|nr:hypothetical protein [Winogradskyella aurantiaca]